MSSVLSFPRRPLSIVEGHHRTDVAHGPILAERREKFRYPLDLSVRFRAPRARSDFSGLGVVVNLSSSGILVISGHDLSVGALVEMSIDWPALLEGRIPLQLFATGRVLRSETTGFAASFERHEFRTRGISLLQA